MNQSACLPIANDRRCLCHPPPVLVLLEGVHDIEFLTRASRVLSQDDTNVPDLASLEFKREIVMLPLGGNGPQAWVDDLASLGKSAFLLFDRESIAESRTRKSTVSLFNAASSVQALLTSKRSIENYLHPQAIFEASGVSVDFGPDDNVAEVVARQRLNDKGVLRDWHSLTTRTRKRLRDRAKHWLNRQAVDGMTAPRLREQDPNGEVVGWLRIIGNLVKATN